LQVPILGYLIEDVQAIIDEQEAERLKQNKEGAPLDWFSNYHTYEDIVLETKRIAAESDIVTFFPSVGKTIQGRDIVGVALHGGPTSPLARRNAFGLPADLPKIVFIGGQHAREWISPATVMYIYNQLVTLYGTDPLVTAWLNQIAIVIVPVSNPDGYDFAWTNNRMWRKNRRANGGSFGVDLNRNWDTHWCGIGSSRNPASDTYCGTAPFSEPETTGISNLIKGLGNVISAIDWHSYSQLILRPWGWTTAPPPNNAYLTTLGNNLKAAIKRTHNLDYTNQASWQLYHTTGSAADWFYEKANITISYTIELRDTGRFGFVLPPAQIVPSGQESWAATRVFIEGSINSL